MKTFVFSLFMLVLFRDNHKILNSNITKRILFILNGLILWILAITIQQLGKAGVYPCFRIILLVAF